MLAGLIFFVALAMTVQFLTDIIGVEIECASWRTFSYKRNWLFDVQVSRRGFFLIRVLGMSASMIFWKRGSINNA